EPEFKLRGSFGTYTQADIVATASVPVSDTLRIGGSVASLNRDGFGKNLTQNIDNYDKQVFAARASIELEPSDSFFVRITGDYADDDSNPRHGHRLIAARLSPGFPVLDDVYDTQGGLTGPPNSEVINRGIAMMAEWTVNDNWTVKNILAYRDGESGQQLDFDSLPSVDIDVPYLLEDDQLSEEFQISYSDDTVDALAGFYYLDANAFNEFDVLLGTTGALIGLPGLNAYTFGNIDTKTWSVFADATIDLEAAMGWTGFEISLGGRYTDDKRTGNIIRRTLIGGRSASFGNTGTVIATTSNFLGKATFKDFTPRAVLAYKPDDDNNLYVSFSQGFKGGGFDPRGQTTAAPDLNNDGTRSADEIYDFMQFDPEKITTYEAGWKTSGFDGKYRSSFAVFYSDYTDVQIPGSIGVDTNNDGIADNFSGVTTNAGKARFYGVEFEGSGVVAEGMGSSGDSLTANWAVGWIDAKFKEFITAVLDPVTGVTSLQNVAAQRNIQNTP
ncbi:MAG: TonB-dependent receptor, partial [Planctomycetales bacterium]|nr:TonB-dependent receptor [Planctomycetales bacterium]